MADINPNELPELDLTAVENELRKEEAYGDRPIEAALGEALSAATLGASDVLATDIAGVPAERLREVRERKPVARTIGKVTGTVGTLLGPAALPKAIGKVLGVGGKAIVGAGEAAAKGAAKLGAGKVAQTAARGAAEGAVVGAGELASDIALEKKDLSAESLLATAGTGALLGAGFGSALGVAGVAVPKVGKVAEKLTKKLKSTAKKSVESITNPVEASLYTLSSSAPGRLKIKERLGKNVDDLPEYFRKDLQLETLDSVDNLLTKNQQALKTAGDDIKVLSQQLDNLTSSGQVPIARAEAYSNLLLRAQKTLDDLGPATKVNRAERRVINNYIDDIATLAAKNEPFSFSEFDALRKQFAGKKFKGGGALESFEANFANNLRGEARDAIDAIAERASTVVPDLAQNLKSANKRYHIGATIDDYLVRASEKAPDITEPIRFAIGLVRDTGRQAARNASIIYNVADRTKGTIDTINKSIDSFFKVANIKPGRALQSAGNAALVNTGFALNKENGKAPKTPKEAFNNISENINTLKTDENALIELLAKRTKIAHQADPALAMEMQSTIVRAVNFVNEKLPRSAVNPGVFQRPYEPSTLEMAKFNRYMQAIESPLTVLQELEDGTLTREHVEALQAVYPAIYRQVQVTAMEKIADKPDLSYQKRLQMGILLDIPADSSLQTENLMQLQALISSPNASNAAQNNSVRAAGVDKISMSSREATDVQKLEADKP